MGLDAALIIRTGSVVLWALLGAWIVWKAGRRNRALGVALCAWGLAIVSNNLFGLTNGGPWPTAFSRFWGVGLYAVFTVAVAFVLAKWSREDGGRMAVPLAFAVFGFALMMAAAFTADSTGSTSIALLDAGVPRQLVEISTFLNSFGGDVVVLLPLYASLQVACSPTQKNARRLAPVALGLGLYFAYQLSSAVVYRDENPLADIFNVALASFVVFAMAGAWLVAAARGAGRRGLLVGNALLAVTLLGLLVPWLAHVPSEQVTVDPTGMKGVLRTIGWAIFLYGILRTDMLGLDLRPRSVTRGTLAATALAALFIVAQVMQNFLSAEYGLVTGGVIAGTFLFAASPVQKAFERMGERKPGANARAAAAPGGNDEAYRNAVRFALRDRRLQPAEELALADLAERLGGGARRATEIRLDVQAERKGVR